MKWTTHQGLTYYSASVSDKSWICITPSFGMNFKRQRTKQYQVPPAISNKWSSGSINNESYQLNYFNQLYCICVQRLFSMTGYKRFQEPCESWGGRPGLSVLMSLTVSVSNIEPCFGTGHTLSLICQPTSEDMKLYIITALFMNIMPTGWYKIVIDSCLFFFTDVSSLWWGGNTEMTPLFNSVFKIRFSTISKGMITSSECAFWHKDNIGWLTVHLVKAEEITAVWDGFISRRGNR